MASEVPGEPVVLFDPLADMTKRLDWADEAGLALAKAIKAFVASEPYRVWSELNGLEGSATLCPNTDTDTEAKALDRCARLIGSFLDHSRAALNYVTYQLALLDAPGNPQLKPESVEFPIFTDRERFAKDNRVKHLSPEHREAICAVQPFDGERPGLWLLHELSRTYRHRLVHPTTLGTFPDDHNVQVTGGRLASMNILYTGQVRYDIPVFTYVVAADRDDVTVHAHANVAISVCIDHPLCEGKQSITVLNEIGRDASEATRALSALVPVWRGGPPAT